MYMQTEHPKLTKTQIDQLVGTANNLGLKAGPGGSGMTPYAETLAAVQPLLAEHFPGRWLQATFVFLLPSQQIVRHADPPIRGTRYHIPIDTNSECYVYHAGSWQKLAEGFTYAMNPAAPHGAVNWGATMRLHVMVDIAEA